MESDTIFESLFLDDQTSDQVAEKVERLKRNNTLLVEVSNREGKEIDKNLNLRYLTYFEGEPGASRYQLLQCKIKCFRYIEGKGFLFNHNISEVQLILSSEKTKIPSELTNSLASLVGLKRVHVTTSSYVQLALRGFWRSVRVRALYVNGDLVKSVDLNTYGAVYDYPPNFTFRHAASTSHVKTIDATSNFTGLQELEASKCTWLEKLKCCLFVDTPPLDVRTRIYPIIIGCHLRVLDTRGTTSTELIEMVAGHPTLERWACGPYVPLEAADLVVLFKNSPNIFWEIWGSQINGIPRDWTVKAIKIVASLVAPEATAVLRQLYTRPESSLWLRRRIPSPKASAERLFVRDSPFYSTVQGSSTLTAISATRCGVQTFDATLFPALTDLDLSENPLLEEAAVRLMDARLNRLAINQCFTRIDGLLLRAGSKQIFECDSPYRKHFDDRTLQLLLDDSGKLRKLQIRYVPEEDEIPERFSHRIDDLQMHIAPIN